MQIQVLKHFNDELTGKGYGPAVYPNEDEVTARRLIERGIAVPVTGEEETSSSTPVQTGPPQDTDLPEDFPGRDKLIECGYTSMDQVRLLVETDTVKTVPGIGNRTAASILERVAGEEVNN